MPGVLGCAARTYLSIVLDELHPEFSQLFLQFDISELLDIVRP
jgi:hypothetical protein